MVFKSLFRQFCACVPLAIAVVFTCVYLLWIVFNILSITMGNHFVSANTFAFLQRFCYSLGFFVIQVAEKNICFTSIVGLCCIFQFLAAVYLLWGIIYESGAKLNVWITYNGLVVGISVLYFVQLFFVGPDVLLNSNYFFLFRIQLVRDLLSFICFNGFYTYQVVSIRNKFRTESIVSNITAAANEYGNNAGVGSTHAHFANKIAVDVVTGLLMFVYGIQVVVQILYLSLVSFASKNIVITRSINLAVSALGLYFTYILWTGNHTGNNKKLFVWMAFQLVACLIEYSSLLYCAAVGVSFDIIILKFLTTFLLAAVVIPAISARIEEIGRSLEYRENFERQGESVFNCNTVQLELQDTFVHDNM